MLFQESPHTVPRTHRFHPVPHQRVALCRQEGGLVAPVLEHLTPLVGVRVHQVGTVRAGP